MFFLPSILAPSLEFDLEDKWDSFDGKAQSCSEEYKSSILSDEPHSMESTRRKTAVRDSYTIDQSRHLLYFLPGLFVWSIFDACLVENARK